jgi:hypothetical protein
MSRERLRLLPPFLPEADAHRAEAAGGLAGASRSRFVFPGDEMMKAPLKYCPDLRDCVLEGRHVPVVPNLGLGSIVLTTGGYVLTNAFPGIAIPASFVMTGSAGISGMQSGNGNGNGGASQTIVIGSGANDSAASIIPLVTRNIVVNDALRAAPLVARVLRDRSDVLPPGQVYRGVVSTEVHEQRGGQDADEGPVEPLPIRLRSRPPRPASDASEYPVGSHADRTP